MKYATEQLPWQDFAVLGMNQMQVLSLPQSTINALLSGNRTSLIRFENVKMTGQPDRQAIDGKLSLKKMETGELQLRIHPVNTALTNNFDLSKTEMNYLESGKRIFIPKLIPGKSGIPEEALISLDPVTNELIAFSRPGMKAPEKINGIQLSLKQKEAFLNGLPVTLDGKDIRLDPNSETPIASNNSHLRLRNGRYRSTDLLTDAILLTAGLGHYVLLTHLARILLHSTSMVINPEQSLRNQSFRDALAEAQKEFIKQHTEQSRVERTNNKESPGNLSIDELINIIEKKAGKQVVIENLERGTKQEPGKEEIDVVQKQDVPGNGLTIENEKPQTKSFKI